MIGVVLTHSNSKIFGLRYLSLKDKENENSERDQYNLALREGGESKERDTFLLKGVVKVFVPS